MTDPRYPIGKFSPKVKLTEKERSFLIAKIALFPDGIISAVEGLTEHQLDTPYREGGWTIRQLVHHCADSHLNAFVRFKLALTEEEPTIKPYKQAEWAGTPDSIQAPVQLSLAILQGVQVRWTILLRSLKAKDFQKAIMHPENGRMTLEHILQLYAWHGEHHIAHIAECRKNKGW